MVFQCDFHQGFGIFARKRIVLSRSKSSVQMNLVPAKSALENGSLGFTRCSVYSVACGHWLSSKFTANKFSGIGVVWIFGLMVSWFSGPLKKLFAFHDALLTVPSGNLMMKPPSPI